MSAAVVESKDSSSNSSSGSEYSSSSGSEASSSEEGSESESSSEYESGEDSSDETESEESEAENPPNDVRKPSPTNPAPSTDVIPPWQTASEPASISNVEKQNESVFTPITESSVPSLNLSSHSSKQKSVSFQEHDNETNAAENISKPDKVLPTKVTPNPPHPDLSSTLKSRSTNLEKKKSAGAHADQNNEEKSVANKNRPQEPVSLTSPISNDNCAKTSPGSRDTETGDCDSGKKTIRKQQVKKKLVPDIVAETNEAEDEVLPSKTRRSPRKKKEGAAPPKSEEVKPGTSGTADAAGSSGSIDNAVEEKAGCSGTTDNAVEQYCFCRGEEYGLMIQCENCSEWYHDECINMTAEQISRIEMYYCTICISKNNKLAIVYQSDFELEMASERLNEVPIKDNKKQPSNRAPASVLGNIPTSTTADMAPDDQDLVISMERTVEDQELEVHAQVSESIAPQDDKESSDEEWLDIAYERDSSSKASTSEPCVNFIARTKEMLAKKPSESEKREVLLPVSKPMDLKRNEYWDENFYKPHINEDLSSCFSQMSIDWASAKEIFSHQTISPLKNKNSGKERTTPAKQITKTPLRGTAQNTQRELSLTEPTTPTRGRNVPARADPEVMKIFERSLLVSPCKTVVRPKDKPSRRLSLVKLDDQVTMNFGKSPSPVTAREMGKKLFSGKHDWNSQNTNEKENSSPKTTRKTQKPKPARKPLFSDKPIDSAWAKGLEDIKGDYPFYSLKKTESTKQTSTPDTKESKKVVEKKLEINPETISEKQNAAKAPRIPKKSKVENDFAGKSPEKECEVGAKNQNTSSKCPSTPEKTKVTNAKVAEKFPEEDSEIGFEKHGASKVTTTPKKSKVNDDYNFKTPTKSTRKMRKKSISSDRQSEGWSPGAKLLEHGCPYDPSESGCYSQTIDSETPIKVPLAPSLDSIIRAKPVQSQVNERTDKDAHSVSSTPRSKKSLSLEADSMDLSRSFDIEFDDISQKSCKSPVKSSQSNVTVKTILPKLLCHLEKSPTSPVKPISEPNSDIVHSNIEKNPQIDTTKEDDLLPEASIDEKSAESADTDSPSKNMKDVPSFIEAPVEDTLDFEENVASPANSSKKVLIGYGSEFCDEGEVFSSDDEECILYNDVREAQRNPLFDSSESNKGVTEISSKQEIEKSKICNTNSYLSRDNTERNSKVNTNSKPLSDREFLERNKLKYSYTSEKSAPEKQNKTHSPEKEKNHQFSEKGVREGLPFTFKPINTSSASAPNREDTPDVRKPIASTPQKPHEERCDTPLSALNDDKQTDQEASHSATSEYSTRSQVPLSTSQENEQQSLKTSMSATKKSDGKQVDTPMSSNPEPVDQDTSTQPFASDMSQILRSCESLSNPSFDKPSPLATKEVVDTTMQRETSSLMATESLGTPAVNKFLSSDEKLADYMPAKSIHCADLVKTPLSASLVRAGDEEREPAMHTDVEMSVESPQEETRPKEGPSTVNIMLSSEETMSTWTPEPSPTETPASDPLNSLPAKRRVSLHDYVIRKEAISKTPTLPDCSFSTPDFAKTKEPPLGRPDLRQPDLSRSESPLAVEHDSSTLESAQSPIPMEHGLLPQAKRSSQNRGELVPKLKYHHLIPIHIPPREFLYCRRVKVIQNMLINELIGGVEFKDQQPITRPLHGTRFNSQESDDHQDRNRARSTSETAKGATEPPGVGKHPAILQQLSDVATSSKAPAPSKSIVPPQQTHATDSPGQELPNLDASKLLEASKHPEPSKQKDAKVSSGMGDAAIHDEESHDYFKNVKIPKVKRVTDSFMSDSSVLNSYDCAPEAIAVGQIIQQSMVSDVSSVGLDSITMPNSFNSSTLSGSGILSREVSDLGSISQIIEPSICPPSTSSTTVENSNDMGQINNLVKQCLFSDESISRSPIISSRSNLSRADSTPRLSVQKTSFTIDPPPASNKSMENELPSQATQRSLDSELYRVHRETFTNSTPNTDRQRTSFIIKHPSVSSDTSGKHPSKTSQESCTSESESIQAKAFANSTPQQTRRKTSFTIAHPSKSVVQPSQTTPKSHNIQSVSVEKEAFTSAIRQSSSFSSDIANDDFVTLTPNITDKEGVGITSANTAKPVLPSSETVKTSTETLSEPAKTKPPKFKIPKKKKPNTAPPAISTTDPLITSPRKIKQFVSSTVPVESSNTSTLFTQRKKKQLDHIVSKERAQREQVLQEYREKEQEDRPSTPVDSAPTPSEESVKSSRKRRKTDSPEIPQTFDLRSVLSAKSSTKPECKRSKRRSGDRNKSDETEVETPRSRRKDDETPRSERKVGKSDDKKESKKGRHSNPQLCFKSKLFDALAVLNTRERNLKPPDKMAGKQASMSHWLTSWKDDEVKLKELRTSRLKIRDPDYKPRDLSKLVLSKVPVRQIVRTKHKPTREETQDSNADVKLVEPGVFGWKDSKPSPPHSTLFPAEQIESVETDPNTRNTSSSTSNPLLSKSNPLLKKNNPLLKNKAGSCSAGSVAAPRIWIECMRRADEAHTNPKQQRKKTVIDYMTTKEVGPLSTLQRALTTKLKVTVVTRTFKGVRGECTGYLVAYDKYMNLALSDVTEHYRSLYHKLPNTTQPSSDQPSTSTSKLQSDPSFVDFKRSVTVTFNRDNDNDNDTVTFDRDMLREIKSPSQSPERTGSREIGKTGSGKEVEKAGGGKELDFIPVESIEEDHMGSPDDAGFAGFPGSPHVGSPGASIRSPVSSPPPSEHASPDKNQSTDVKKVRTFPPRVLGWAKMIPENRKFKYTKNCITTRHCKQVFLRGDNVVLVRLVE